MWGTIVNAAAIIVGGLAGTFFNKSLPQRYHTIVFQAMGLFVAVLGVTMALKMKHELLCVLALLLGGLSGEALRLDVQMDKLGDWLKRTLRLKDEQFSEGFVTASLLFCIGAMAILGSIEEGSGKYPTILLTKSVMDGFSAIALAAAFGAGVCFSSAPLLVYQGLLTLLALLFGRLLSEAAINELAAVGGMLLVGLGVNLLGFGKIKTVNLLPALLFIGLLLWLFP